jgi:hypothetical protein
LLPFFSQGADGIKKTDEPDGRTRPDGWEDGIKALGDLADETDFLGLAFQVTRDRIIAPFAPDLIKASNGFLNWLKENRARRSRTSPFISRTKRSGSSPISITLSRVTSRSIVRGFAMDAGGFKDFGDGRQTVVFGIIIPAFQTLMTTLDSVAQGINATFGTQADRQRPRHHSLYCAS